MEPVAEEKRSGAPSPGRKRIAGESIFRKDRGRQRKPPVFL